MNALGSIYYHFTVQPYSHKILRSLKKEGKIYLYDWSSVEDEGVRFENMVASHLLKLIHFYNDTGQANLSLSYLRNKQKQEVDFILLNKKKPVLTIEVKLSDYNLDKTFLKFQKRTQNTLLKSVIMESFCAAKLFVQSRTLNILPRLFLISRF